MTIAIEELAALCPPK